MIYVALLRGINVGGKSKVEMSRLKLVFESVGCQDVTTYINSGNVVFRDMRNVSEAVPHIEQAILKEFSLNIRVLVRDFENIRKICKTVPLDWTNDTKQKTDVLFLSEEIDSPKILDNIEIKPAIDNVRYISGALIWNIEREYATRGNAIKLVRSNLYPYITIRNINTVRKLYALMR